MFYSNFFLFKILSGVGALASTFLDEAPLYQGKINITKKSNDENKDF